MTGVLLFCTAIEAEPFVPRVLATDKGEGYFRYYLAESRHGPSGGPVQELRERLADNEAFKNDFIGASVEECGAWTHEQQAKNKTVDQDLMVVLDARSAEDQSITLWFYPRDVNAPNLGENQKVNIWYPFRIPYSKVVEIASELTLGDADESWGVYFHRKAELTNQNGIFDVDRARELVIQGEGFVFVEEE